MNQIYSKMMTHSRAIGYSTVFIILLVTVASGPLVSAVDLTTSDNSTFGADENGIDRVSIEVIEEPIGGVVLDQAEFGNKVFRLLTPPLTIRVNAVRGRPRVTYKVRIQELGYARLTTFILSEEFLGESLTLGITEDTIIPDRVRKQQYSAELIVTVHDDSGATVIYQTNVTAVVRD